MKRLFHHLTLATSALLAAVALTIVPAIGTAHHVAAMGMNHASMPAMAAPTCPQLVSTGVIPEEPTVDEQERAAPDPVPIETASYHQPQVSPQPKEIKPQGVYADGLLRPPDILRQAAVLRL